MHHARRMVSSLAGRPRLCTNRRMHDCHQLYELACATAWPLGCRLRSACAPRRSNLGLRQRAPRAGTPMPADPRPAGARWGGPGDSGGRAPGACSAMHAGCAAAHTHLAASLLAAAPALADTFDAPTSASGALTARMVPQTARPRAGAHVPTPFPLAHSLSIFSSRAPRPPPAPAAGASPALVQPPSAAAAPGARPRPRSNLGAPSPHALPRADGAATLPCSEGGAGPFRSQG